MKGIQEQTYQGSAIYSASQKHKNFYSSNGVWDNSATFGYYDAGKTKKRKLLYEENHYY